MLAPAVRFSPRVETVIPEMSLINLQQRQDVFLTRTQRVGGKVTGRSALPGEARGNLRLSCHFW